MKKTELRIGNLALGVNGLVIEVGWEELMDLSDGFNELNPIPLTDEWLLKFGFQNKSFDNDSFVHKDKNEYFSYLQRSINGGYFHLESGNFDEISGRTILYVHQLQNLYFALTGEELQLQND